MRTDPHLWVEKETHWFNWQALGAAVMLVVTILLLGYTSPVRHYPARTRTNTLATRIARKIKL
jgi:hypothetical protein